MKTNFIFHWNFQFKITNGTALALFITYYYLLLLFYLKSLMVLLLAVKVNTELQKDSDKV